MSALVQVKNAEKGTGLPRQCTRRTLKWDFRGIWRHGTIMVKLNSTSAYVQIVRTKPRVSDCRLRVTGVCSLPLYEMAEIRAHLNSLNFKDKSKFIYGNWVHNFAVYQFVFHAPTSCYSQGHRYKILENRLCLCTGNVLRLSVPVSGHCPTSLSGLSNCS